MFSSIRLPQAVPDTEVGGGFVTNLKALNALSTQNMNNRLLQAQGNLAQQQANFTPYQQATQALSNPSLWMTPEGRAAGQNIIAQLPKLIQQGAGAGGGGNNLSQLDSPSLGKMILGKIFGKLSGLLPEQRDATIGQQGNSNSLANLGNPAQPSGVNAPSSIPGLAAAQQNSGGFETKPNPIQTQADEAAAQTASVTGQVGNQTEEQKAFNNQVNAASTAALNADKFLSGWKRNYDKATYKGQYFGSHPVSGNGSIPNFPGHNNSPEQLADNYKDKLIQTLTGIEGSPAGQTDLARELITNAKGVGLQLDEDAAKELKDSMSAGFKRLNISRKFVDSFQKNNPKETIEHLVAMMNEYNKYAPSYDYEKGKSLPENDKKFRDFTSKEAMQSYIDNGEYNPYEKKSDEITPNEFINSGKKNPSKKEETRKAVESSSPGLLAGLPPGRIEETGFHNGKPSYKIGGQWYGVK